MFECLLEAQPDWFSGIKIRGSSLFGIVILPQTIWNPDGIEITITRAKFLEVRESKPGKKLPKLCHERHIQPDSLFCLSLWDFSVHDLQTARVWWEQLRQFLVCQSVAHEIGIWPTDNSLDHGDAGGFHEKVLKIANKIGILDEYNELHEGLISTFRSSTLAGLAPGKKHRVKKLLTLDRRRHELLNAFNSRLVQSGASCCGTMKNCPLPKRQLVRKMLVTSNKHLTSTALTTTMTSWTR